MVEQKDQQKKAEAPQKLDQLNVEQDEEYTRQFVSRKHPVPLLILSGDSELVVMFSGKVFKWNKYFMKQERQLVITNLNIYNFAKKSNFRPLTCIRGPPRHPSLHVRWADQGPQRQVERVRHPRQKGV